MNESDLVNGQAPATAVTASCRLRVRAWIHRPPRIARAHRTGSYRILLWPVAWPSSKLLDAWIGPEGIPWLRERELRQMLEQHARDLGTEISHVEAAGAINFLALDDLPVGREGEPLDP